MFRHLDNEYCRDVLAEIRAKDTVNGILGVTEALANVLTLRQLLREAGLDYYGDPSAIVCVKMGTEGLAWLVSKQLLELGLIANLVEFPAVPKSSARIRTQVMANHSQENIAVAVQILKNAKARAELEFAKINRSTALTRVA